MDIKYSRKEKIVGLFVIVLFFLMLASVVIIGRGKHWFKAYTEYYALFDESYNLSENSPVKISKADIGRVKSIALQKDKVKIIFKIWKDYAPRIRADSIATVESPTFIGSEYVSILPGSADSGLLPPKSEIKSREKKSVQDILNEFEVEKTAKKFVRAVQDFSEIAAVMRKSDGPLFSATANINKILAHVEKITKSIESGEGTLGSLLKSKAVIAKIENQLDKIENIFGSLEKATGKTPKIMQQVLESIESVKKLVDDIHINMEAVKTILKNTEKGSNDFPEITRTTRHGIHEIRQSVENIDEVVQSIKSNPLIRHNLPQAPQGENLDVGLR